MSLALYRSTPEGLYCKDYVYSKIIWQQKARILDPRESSIIGTSYRRRRGQIWMCVPSVSV